MVSRHQCGTSLASPHPMDHLQTDQDAASRQTGQVDRAVTVLVGDWPTGGTRFWTSRWRGRWQLRCRMRSEARSPCSAITGSQSGPRLPLGRRSAPGITGAHSKATANQRGGDFVPPTFSAAAFGPRVRCRACRRGCGAHWAPGQRPCSQRLHRCLWLDSGYQRCISGWHLGCRLPAGAHWLHMNGRACVPSKAPALHYSTKGVLHCITWNILHPAGDSAAHPTCWVCGDEGGEERDIDETCVAEGGCSHMDVCGELLSKVTVARPCEGRPRPETAAKGACLPGCSSPPTLPVGVDKNVGRWDGAPG